MTRSHRARRALASGARWLALIVAIEVLLLLAEAALTRAVGQRAIAAAMLTAPSSGEAWLGLGLVLTRITAHALGPAAGAMILVLALFRGDDRPCPAGRGVSRPPGPPTPAEDDEPSPPPRP